MIGKGTKIQVKEVGGSYLDEAKEDDVIFWNFEKKNFI